MTKEEFDKIVARIETLDAQILVSQGFSWESKGLTLRHGSQVGDRGWNAHTTGVRFSVFSETLDGALIALQDILEEAFAKYLAQQEATLKTLKAMQEIK